MTSILLKCSLYRPQLRQSLRVTAAALAAFAANLLLDFQQGYWMAFTAIIIVQSSVGGSVKAAVERMTGTLAGAAYGALVSTLLPHDTPALFALTVVVGLAPAAFAAALSPMFRIAPVTVAILLFSNTAQHMTPLSYAGHRASEIGLGCVIGLIASVIILPSRAHNLLAEAASQALAKFAALFARQVEMAEQAMLPADIDAQYAEIRKMIAKLDVTAEEARRERRSYLTGEPDPEPLVRMVRRVRNDLVMIGRSVATPLPAAALPFLLAPLKDVAVAAEESLLATAAALSGPPPAANKITPAAEKLTPAEQAPRHKLDACFSGFAAAMGGLQLSGKSAAEADASRLFTLNFALGQLHQNLKDLADRAAEFRSGEAES